MLAIQLVVASAAFVGLALGKSNNPNILTPRQFGGASLDVNAFPTECKDTCSPYLDGGQKCAEEVAKPNASPNALYDCVCTSEFFNALADCARCAPEAFQSGNELNAQQVVSLAMSQCASMGHTVNGVNTEGLDQAASSAASLASTSSPSASSSASSVAAVQSSIASSAISSVSSSASSVAAAASSALSSASSSVAAAAASPSQSAAPSAEGGAVALSAQKVVYVLVAAAIGAVMAI